jgi:cytochrome P450
MDLAQKIPMFTLDVISSVGFGTAFGMLAADTDINGYMASSATGLRVANLANSLGRPMTWFLALPLVRRMGPSAKDSYGFGKMMGTVFEFVDRRVRQGGTDKRSDMLASFMRHGLFGDDLRSEAMEQVVAGSDTTAAAIRGTMLLLLTSPSVFSRLRTEIDEAVSAGKAPHSPNVISKAQADVLPYLQAVIREGMRIKVPVVCIFPRDVPPSGETWEINGMRVILPGGTQVGYSGTAMHRSKEIYGDDADCFRPERWLESDADSLTAMTRTNDLIFGHGRWQCLGKSVAMFELGKVIFEVCCHGLVAMFLTLLT